MGLKRTKHTYIYVLHHTQARLKYSLKVWALTDKFMLVYATIPMNNYEAKISVLLLVCTTSALAPQTFQMVSVCTPCLFTVTLVCAENVTHILFG